MYGPAFTATGKGLVPWGPVDAEGWVGFHRELVALRPDVETRLTHVLAIGPNRILSVATDFDGDDVEVHNVFVAEIGPDTKYRWLETYGVRQLDDARRRYEQIGTRAALDDRFTNAAVRTNRRMTEAFNRKDIAAVMDCWAPDGILEDRRRLLQQSLHGRSEANRQNLEFIARGDGHTVSRDLATRGDRLALGELGWQGDNAEFTLLALFRVDNTERFDLIIWFDTDDLEAAYAELDQLWEAEVGPRARNFLSFVNDRDWDGAAAQLAVDCVLEDHRPARLGRVVGRDRILDLYRSTIELTPDARARWHQAMSSGGAGIAITSMAGTNDGAAYELRAVAVLGRDPEGRVRSMDFYDEADLEAAFARFDDIAAGSAAEDRFANAAVRAYGRFNIALDAGDVQAVEACFAPEFRLDDRRTLLQLTVEGPAYHESIRYIVAGDGITTSQLLATRGDRLSLHHATWDSDGTQISLLIVERVDDQERIDLGFWFDPDDVDAAYEELDRQYLELGASRSYLMFKRLVDGINERDWGAVEALLAPDSVVDDHRPIRFGELVGRDAFVDFYRSTIELAPDARLVTHHHIGDDRVGIRLVSLVGTMEGAPFENPAITVYQLDDHGRHTHRDFYGPDQIDEAFARYDELAALGTPLTDSPFSNAAVRSIEAFKAGFHSGDSTRALEAFAPDIALEDRRRLFRHSLRGREVFEYAEAGVRSAAHLSDELVATRGDRLALIRRMIRFPERTVGAAESERMTLAEVDEGGRFTFLGYFDVDDLDAALEELDRRYIATLDGPNREFYVEVVRGAEAYGRDDLDRIASRIGSEFVVHDHRPFGFGTLDRSGWIDHMRRLKDEAPGSQIRFHHIRQGHGVWLRINSIVGMAQSGEFELLSAHVTTVGPDGLDRTLDIYGIEQLDDALAQLEALGESRPFANLATQNSERFVAALLSGDREAVAAVHAPEFLGSDRRRFVQLEGIGSDLYEWRFIGEPRGWSSGSQVVATRGSRLALIRSLVTTFPEPSAPTERDFLALVEVDDDGLRTAAILFDVDDLDAAFEELDARYVALGGPDYGGLVRTYAARDWDSFAARFTADFTVHDHRHGGWGRIDRSTFMDHARSLVELSPDAQMRIVHSRDVSTAGIMLGASFGSVEGGEYEREFVTVAHRNPDGRVTAYHLFDVDDLAEARRLYDELQAAGD